MKEGRVIREHRHKHVSVVKLRTPRKGDANSARDFINELVKEDVKIGTNKEFSLNEEKDYINKMIKNIQSRHAVSVIADDDGKIVGMCSIERRKHKESHVGVLGISVLESYRGKGLGKTLMKTAIDLARKHLHLEIIVLSVFDNNKIAIDLYRKMGFRYTGNIPRGIKHKGKYIDHNIMVKML